MKYADINKRYTEIVTEYVSKGYAINTISMGGSQGETAKVDLTDGTEIIRVLVATFSDWKANVEGVEIITGRVVDKSIKPHNNSGWDTIWNNQLEVIATERYYPNRAGQRLLRRTGRGRSCGRSPGQALHRPGVHPQD